MNTLRSHWPWLAIATWSVAAFALSCHLTGSPLRGDATDTAAHAMLGHSRLGMARHFYEIADLYFHRGVDHEHEEGIYNSVFQRLSAQLHPGGHVHADGQQLTEIMPWLRLATRLDPHNVEMITVAAFWLGRSAGRYDLAEELLHEAMLSNPRNHEIQIERARLFLRGGRTDRALGALNAAHAFWPSRMDPDGRDAQIDLDRILMYRALAHEALNERQAAIRDLESVLRRHPERHVLRERISALAANTAPVLTASTMWRNLLRSEDTARAETPHASHDHDAPHHDH